MMVINFGMMQKLCKNQVEILNQVVITYTTNERVQRLSAPLVPIAYSQPKSRIFYVYLENILDKMQTYLYLIRPIYNHSSIK
ncbi:hypothetical protein BpHYR1_030105 [Brachionus plicatilis]|uniref:Uncharacterized protein n=1 Tax=Brachionus plicatilis TaxID=10195 RepID=A0A3M7PUK4_BRAPC|nr:hypothetical protein BpHYR1_030105 [Brachionus plicatilis]